MRSPAISTLLLLIGLSCHADEAVCRDGHRIEGTLTTDASRLRFVPADPKLTVPLAAVEYIRIADAAVPAALFGMPLRIQLTGGQHLTGELLGLDETSLSLRTFWSEKLQVPRRSVVAIMQPSGLVTIHHEDFEGDLSYLKRTGAPPVDDSRHTSGRRSLKLHAVGQAATHVLPDPLNAGRFGVNFHDSGDASGGHWLVEADFNGKRRVAITLAGDGDDCTVETDLAGEKHSLARTPGWHRLSVRFRADYLLVGIDGRLLYECAKQGPAAPLTTIRLACVARSPAQSLRGAVHFDDLSLAKPLDDLAHPPGDAAQDEIWLLPGDQLFGRIVRADRRGIEIHGRFGKRSLPWTVVRGIFLQASAPETKTTDGEHVRLLLRSGFAEPDQLDVVLRSLDAEKIAVRHPLLGDLQFDRARVHRIRPVSDGRPGP